MLSIELTHAIGVEKNQRDEHVNRSLIREPEAEFVSTKGHAV
jgi:hypothetical protein